MAPYIYKRNHEGIHIINLGKTWEKLMIAARVMAAIPHPSDVLVSHFLSPILFADCEALAIPLGWQSCEYRSYLTENTLKEQC